MLTFNEFSKEALNEDIVSFNKMTFTVSQSSNTRGVFIQFIPDSKTFDNYSKKELADAIKSQLEKKIGNLSDAFSYDPSLHTGDLINWIEQSPHYRDGQGSITEVQPELLVAIKKIDSKLPKEIDIKVSWEK
jgi:hypothetical protein